MRPEDEPVALFDASGTPTGVAPRGVVYRDGLWHASSAVLVRSGDGRRVYVHRRTPTKLVFPGCYDCWAGGVIGPGETPDAAAARELAEELGITGVPLTPIERFAFTGEAGGVVQRYHVFSYETRWDGPIVWQPTEVDWGAWVTFDELRAMLADPRTWPFVADGRAAIGRRLDAAERGPTG